MLCLALLEWPRIWMSTAHASTLTTDACLKLIASQSLQASPSSTRTKSRRSKPLRARRRPQPVFSLHLARRHHLAHPPWLLIQRLHGDHVMVPSRMSMAPALRAMHAHQSRGKTWELAPWQPRNSLVTAVTTRHSRLLGQVRPSLGQTHIGCRLKYFSVVEHELFL